MRANKNSLSFITLFMMISFASVNAVLFTPALPEIAQFFKISSNEAQSTVTWYLIGYTLGQLIYGPIASRFDRKPTLYIGISLQIFSSLLCVFAGKIDAFWLLVLSRFFLALGAGVGLKMAFTLINECYEPKMASQKTSYLVLAFAIAPGIGVALGGFLNLHFGWESCFYAGALYGLILLISVTRLPSSNYQIDRDALKISHIFSDYRQAFTNSQLLLGAFLLGSCTAFIYIFAATAPFIAIHLFQMTSAEYGLANLLPSLGIVLGAIISAQLAKQVALTSIIKFGTITAAIGVGIMVIATLTHQPPFYTLFLTTIIIYFGLAFVVATAATFAMSQISDKAHSSAVMNFINMGVATVLVLTLGYFTISTILLPIVFVLLSLFMLILLNWVKENN